MIAVLQEWHQQLYLRFFLVAEQDRTPSMLRLGKNYQDVLLLSDTGFFSLVTLTKVLVESQNDAA